MRPLVRLLAVGGSSAQRGAALLVGQFAAPPLEEGDLDVPAGHGRCFDMNAITPVLLQSMAVRHLG